MKVSGVGLLWGSLGRAVGIRPPGWELRVALIPEAGPQGVVDGQTTPTNPTPPPPSAGSLTHPENRSCLVCGYPSVSLKTPFVWGGERGVCGTQQRWDSWTRQGRG